MLWGREADEGLVSEEGAGFGRRQVLCAEVDAGAAAIGERHGDVDAVVDHDERTRGLVEVGALEELEDAHRPVVGRARLGGGVGDQAFGEGVCDWFGTDLDHVYVGQEEFEALERIVLGHDLGCEDEEQTRVAEARAICGDRVRQARRIGPLSLL
jgi:hypothetical protein